MAQKPRPYPALLVCVESPIRSIRTLFPELAVPRVAASNARGGSPCATAAYACHRTYRYQNFGPTNFHDMFPRRKCTVSPSHRNRFILSDYRTLVRSPLTPFSVRRTIETQGEILCAYENNALHRHSSYHQQAPDPLGRKDGGAYAARLASTGSTAPRRSTTFSAIGWSKPAPSTRLERKALARLLLRPLRAQRRRPRRRPHLHLLALERQRRSHQQLGRPLS